MALEFKLPDIGEGVAEGEIVKWLVKPGDVVGEHQSIVEVMTDKATVEIPSPAAGKILELLAKEGQVVPVGSVLFRLETGIQQAGEGAGQGGPTTAAAAQTPQRTQTSPPAPSPSPARPPPAQSGAQPGAQPAAPRAAPGSGAVGRTGRIEFKLPDIGEGVAEGEIVKWLAQVGETVKEHQSIVEVMTDKATVEIPAPAAGKLLEQRAAAGKVVPVGSVLFVLETSESPAPAMPQPPAREREAVAAAAPAARAEAGAGEKTLAVPSARRVARELGIELGAVPGSGRHGIVRRADVEAFAKSRETAAPARTPQAAQAPGAAKAGAPAPVAVPSGARETRIPFRGVRRKIAEAMLRSQSTAAHFTVVEEVDATELVRLREQAKTIGAESNVKVTFMPFIMKATALALAKHPMLNGRLDEAAQEIVRFHHVDLGIAIDTDQGLIVPVIREVQSKGILQLAAELAELADRTRTGKVKQEELRGSTFSITNAGNIGGILATPIINFPDIAILGVHRLMKRPGVVETPQGERIEVRQYMNLSVSVDHRLADGADGARFLVYLKKLLESPGLLAL
jgi:pyruvate dehydrogenase E2 component (dihydrolipoyllysine-residue acetyltransferase)